MTEITFQPLGNPIAAGEGLEHIADIDPRLTRTNYFDGRLLTAEDLTRDQIYLDQRLRELGRVMGHGIVSGLELTFDRYTRLLTLQPGQAVTADGRVLELGSPLVVNLGNRALISTLNDGNYRRFNRALYAVVLSYVEVGTDIAEVFPRDLASKRGFQYDLITESVQMGLVSLPLPLAQETELQTRCRLMSELLGNSRVESLIPEDGVALGILAIQDDTPQWLDQELLRLPLRAELRLGDLQSDLSRHYERLLADVLANRRSGRLNGDFGAATYFSLLPPVGTVPKDAIDPVKGRQGYFPENYQVAIAPVRQSDVELIKAESLSLPPIAVTNGEPVDVVVLAVLSNQDYGYYAAQLERDYDPATRRLPQIDLLRLKLYPVRPVHTQPGDESAWSNIWQKVTDNQIFYVRRPSRAAETAISGIVLALDSELPAPPAPIPSPADSGGLIQDGATLFLERINLTGLGKNRPPLGSAGETALAKMATEFARDALVAQQTASVLMRIEREFDDLVWQTLYPLARARALDALMAALLHAEPDDATAKVVASAGEELGLDTALIDQWAKRVA
jgi:hypothetical protein